MFKLFATTCVSIAMLIADYPKENKQINTNATAVTATSYGKTSIRQ